MKVLISAYACEPGKGSEPGVGWHWAIQAASVADDVMVLTRQNNREAIESCLAEIPSNLRFEYLELSDWSLRLKAGPRRARLYYVLWQKQVARWLEARLASEEFDVVHHLTWASINLPVGAANSSIPLVLGPLGGGVGTCWPLWRDFGLRGMIFELHRTALQRINQMRPSVRRCLLKAHVILVQNEETAARVPRRARANVRVVSNGGVEPREVSAPLVHPLGEADQMVKAIYAGRVLHWKGLHTALKALSDPEGSGIELLILGSGADLPRVRRKAQRLGVASRVRFAESVDRTIVLKALDESDVLLLLSHHDEGAPFIVVEALARGVRPIVLARGGPLRSIGRAGVALPVRPVKTLPKRVAIACREAEGITPTQVYEHALSWVWASRAESLRTAYLDAIGATSVVR